MEANFTVVSNENQERQKLNVIMILPRQEQCYRDAVNIFIYQHQVMVDGPGCEFLKNFQENPVEQELIKYQRELVNFSDQYFLGGIIDNQDVFSQSAFFVIDNTGLLDAILKGEVKPVAQEEALPPTNYYFEQDLNVEVSVEVGYKTKDLTGRDKNDLMTIFKENMRESMYDS